MKRSAATALAAADSQPSSSSSSSPKINSNPASKLRNPRRPRSLQACTSCRKSKARCELLEDLNTLQSTQDNTLRNIRCHRCKTLDSPCSFSQMDLETLQATLTRKSRVWEQILDFNDVSNVDGVPAQVGAGGTGSTGSSTIHNPPSLLTLSSSTAHSNTTPTPQTRIASNSSNLRSSSNTCDRFRVPPPPLDISAISPHLWNYYMAAPGKWRYAKEVDSDESEEEEEDVEEEEGEKDEEEENEQEDEDVVVERREMTTPRMASRTRTRAGTLTETKAKRRKRGKKKEEKARTGPPKKTVLSLDWVAPLGSVRELGEWYLRENFFGMQVPPGDSTSMSITRTSRRLKMNGHSREEGQNLGELGLSKMLGRERMDGLLGIFDTHFLPWLNINLIHTDKPEHKHSTSSKSTNPDPNSILDLIRCTIASRRCCLGQRHISHEEKQSLYLSTNSVISKIIHQARNETQTQPCELEFGFEYDEVEAIQCLLICALWAPTPSPSFDNDDADTVTGTGAGTGTRTESEAGGRNLRARAGDEGVTGNGVAPNSMNPSLGGPYQPKDSRESDSHLLLSVAMILANRMGLEEIPGRLRELRDEGTRRKGRRERQRENERDGDRDEAQAIDLELEKKIREAEDLTRLWIALLNADALLCAGTRRAPTSHSGTHRLNIPAHPQAPSSSFSRQPQSQSQAYYDSFPLPLVIPPPLPHQTAGRDCRSHLFGRIFEGMNLGVSATLTRRRRGNRHRWGCTTSTSPASSSPGDDDSTTHGDSKIDVDRWYAQVTRSLQHLGMVGRLTGSLGVIAEYDKFHFRMLHVVYLCCRLLVLQRATLTARTLFTTTAPSTNSDYNKPTTTTTADNDNSSRHSHSHRHPSSESKSSTSADSSSPPHHLPHNLEILTLWGREAHSVSEFILALLLEPDIASAFGGETPNGVPRLHGKEEEEGKGGGMLINALPDRVFDMITFAAVFLVSFRFLVWNGKSRRARREEGERGAGTVGSADVLLERVRRVLEEAAWVEDAENGGDAEEEEEVRMMEYLEQLEHPAKKSAMLIGAVMRLWENRSTMVRERGREGEGQNWEKDIRTRENMVDSDMPEGLGVASVNSSNAHDITTTTTTSSANKRLPVPMAELELGQVEGTERLCSTQSYGSDNVMGNGTPMMSEQLPPSHVHHHQRSYVAAGAGGPSPGPHLISPLPPHPGPSRDTQSIPPTTGSTHTGNTMYTSPDSIPQIQDIMAYDGLATPFQAQPQPPPTQPQAFHDFDFDPYLFFQMFAPPPPPGPIGYTTGDHTNRTGDNWMDLDESAIYGYNYWDPQFQVGNGL